MKTTLWTVGHSTHSWEEFVGLLQAYELQAVADVRRLPGSRRLPQFDQDSLAKRLEKTGIAYRWFPKLGGRRKARKDSPNTGWRNLSFRGYADYLASEEFAEGLEELIDLGQQERTTLMCAEAVWWRCHRRLIADVLLLQGYRGRSYSRCVPFNAPHAHAARASRQRPTDLSWRWQRLSGA